MDYIRALICRVDEAEQMTEIASFDVEKVASSVRREAEHTLNDLEAVTQRAGSAILRRLLQVQWEQIDEQLTDAYMRRLSPASVQRDGQEALKVVSCFGVVELSRQVCVEVETQQHRMPGNAVLPVHQGMLITRGVQEWACLLSQEVSFATVARLLSWQTQEPQLLSSTTLRKLVRAHGQRIREAEQHEVTVLEQQADTGGVLQLVIPPPSQRRPGWPAALTAAVEAALAAEQVCPPEGVSWADWTRVLAARRTEASPSLAALRHLGPELAPGQVLLTVDEVLTRQPAPHHFWELRTAKLVTPTGVRALSGSGEAFLLRLRRLAVLATASGYALLLIADGARWIRANFAETLHDMPDKQLILDWYHLHHKCCVFCWAMVTDRTLRAPVLRRLVRQLWQGKVASAIRFLEQFRPQAQDPSAVERFITYLHTHQTWIPNYRQRRIDRRYIGSAHVEKTTTYWWISARSVAVCNGVFRRAMP